MSKSRLIVIVLAGVAVASLIGGGLLAQGAKPSRGMMCGLAMCPSDMPVASQPASQPKAVNSKCPIMGGAIDPDKVPASLTRQYKGQTVGFCCGGCPGTWDRLSDAEKASKLQAAMAK